YAMKANANKRILETVSSYGFGADCVSGNEIRRAIECGTDPTDIAFAGVGKTDDEIRYALKQNIFSFNVESLPELEVINDLARAEGTIAPVAIRINPNVEAFTHKYITTGIEENKFGVNLWELENFLERLAEMPNARLTGIHFHIGSQVRRMTAFRSLCTKVNEIQDWLNNRNIYPDHVNMGGGLGISYENPDEIPDFKSYFELFNEFLELRPGQEVHFEPGRSVVGQAGSLITRVLYMKNGTQTNFAIVDAGMTDLIRPALYQAYHRIDNLTSEGEIRKYNVVGPICESTDSFGKFLELNETRRGDLLAIRSAGAYGEIMVSNYNLRDNPGTVYSDEL
ncbi:MAG: diaminopimelate decarboxylase, partial [Bacteroidia bacterium]